MEQELNPDRFFEKDADGDDQHGEPKAAGQPGTGPGATDIFGTISPASTVAATEWSSVQESPAPESPVRAPASEPVMSRTPLPVVHEVVFQSNASSSESSDPLMQLLRSTPPAPKSAEATPVPAAAPASNGGFTQLLRALNYEQLKPAEPMKPPVVTAPTAPSPVPPPIAVGSITQLLRTFDETPAPVSVAETVVQSAIRSLEEARPIASPPPPIVAPVPLVAALPQEPQPVVPVTAVEPVAANAAPSNAATEAGSFTQIFSSVEVKKAEEKIEAVPEPAGSGGFTQMFEALGTTANEETVRAPEEHAPAVSAPSSFTQMFQTLDAAPSRRVSAPHVEEPVIAANEPGSFTQMFSTPAPVPQSEPVRAEAQPSSPGPGSFTQMFRALDAAPVTKTEAAPPPLPSPAPTLAAPGSFTQMFSTPAPQMAVETPAPAAASPGSFTQMFRALDAQPVEAAPLVYQAPASVPPPAAGAGSFTQLFSTLDSTKDDGRRVDTPPARSDVGSFTQMFGSSSGAPEPTRDAPHVAPMASGQETSMSGASQMFATYRPAAEAPRPDPGFSPIYDPAYGAPARPAPPSAPVGGGLTQLLRTLDQPTQSAGQSYAAPAEVPSAGGQQPGAFTAVYGSLKGTESAPPPVAPAPAFSQPASPFSQPAPVASRDATQAFRVPASAAPLSPPVSAGPSEFTRILNASQLREAALRGGGEGAAAPQAASPTGAPGVAFPPMAAPHVAMPQVAMPHMGGAAQPAPAMPHAPAAPQMPAAPKMPELPKPAPAAGKMQQFLPLLLILIIFLLLAILVAVIFLMKK